MTTEPGFPEIEVNQGSSATPRGNAKEKLPAIAHVLCGWPLLLVAVGGAVGGALGGLGYGINVAIYKSNMPVPVKAILNLVTGLGMIVLWMAAATAIYLAMHPNGR